jgi:prolyl-tRNA editing enzyme YbaK/EbsC (Cys-tRNA(Pro) deacylase)
VIWPAAGSLDPVPVLSALNLVARPVGAAVLALDPDLAPSIGVAAIDPDLADTAAFCERYGSPLERSANCVVIKGKRGSDIRFAACVVLATTRADVNGLVRRRLDARSASFAPMDEAVESTGMEYGGITPLGLPRDWPVLVDPAVAASDGVVIGAGVRAAKLFLPGAVLAALPHAEVVEGLSLPPR